MGRRIYIIPKLMKIVDAVEDAKRLNCSEIAQGIPPSLAHRVDEFDLPLAYEEELLPDIIATPLKEPTVPELPDVERLLQGREAAEEYFASPTEQETKTSLQKLWDLGFDGIDSFMAFDFRLSVACLNECFVTEGECSQCKGEPSPRCKAAPSYSRGYNEDSCMEVSTKWAAKDSMSTGKEIKTYRGVTARHSFISVRHFGETATDDGRIYTACPVGRGFYRRKIKEPPFDWKWSTRVGKGLYAD